LQPTLVNKIDNKKGEILKKIISITLALGLVSTLFAEPNVPLDMEKVKEKMSKVAGEVSPFIKWDFSKGLFSKFQKILPFAIGITLSPPGSSGTRVYQRRPIEADFGVKGVRGPW